MVRLASYAESSDLPWILDLDDLLSRRYSNVVNRTNDCEMVLGYYSEFIPRFLRPLLSKIVIAFLRRESKILYNRENELAKRATVTCLVARDEAKELSDRIGKPIFSMPMAIQIPDEKAIFSQKKRTKSMVFVGGMDYLPNFQAVRYYTEKIVPELIDAKLSDITLHVIGYCPEKIYSEFSQRHIVFEGYVENLFSALIEYKIFLAPIVSGTGIKTKVLEAMACGLPVVSTPEGVKGLDVTDGKECFIADSPKSFVTSIRKILDNPTLAKKVGVRGRQYVISHFSMDVMIERWKQVIDMASVTSFFQKDEDAF
jgi:glycosyltransferase involved in cell wall biosynthesis